MNGNRNGDDNGSRAAVERQRAVEREALAKEAGGGSHAAEQGEKRAVQCGARIYPAPPFPKRHLAKPGLEAALDPAPMYDAPYYKGSDKLLDKVAIVTGGDSGIGRSVAVLFAREGADVCIVHLDETHDAITACEAIEAEGRKCMMIRGDVSDRDFCLKVVRETMERLGPPDILVNNAAFQMHAHRFEDITPEHFDLTLKTNLYGYFFMAQAAAEHMQAGSAIINTGSVTGIDGSRSLLDYSMTKGGIHAFTRSLAGSLIKRGIRVNCVAPGPVWTPLNPADKTAEEIVDFGKSVPMGRPAQPEEIAPAYVFLASSQCSSYITGEILPIIGGY